MSPVSHWPKAEPLVPFLVALLRDTPVLAWVRLKMPMITITNSMLLIMVP